VKKSKLLDQGDSDSPGSERKSVLLVDDAPENLTILIDLLGHDFRVFVAESGQSARRLESRNQQLIRENELQKAIQEEIEHRMRVGILVTVKHAVWQIESCSDLARELFKKHYDLSLSEVLPEPFYQSIEHSSRPSWTIPSRSGRLLTSFYSIWKEAFRLPLKSKAEPPVRRPTRCTASV
jgi:CheY-like chemotaxis protein